MQKSDGGGLGLQQDDMKLNDTQFREPHTGILYTPPKPLGADDEINPVNSVETSGIEFVVMLHAAEVFRPCSCLRLFRRPAHESTVRQVPKI